MRCGCVLGNRFNGSSLELLTFRYKGVVALLLMLSCNYIPSAISQTVDSFQLNCDAPVQSSACIGESRLLVLGVFSKVNGEPHPGIIEIDSSGSILRPWTDSIVVQNGAAAIQDDGCIVIYGVVSSNTVPTYSIVRLLPNGSIDPQFKSLKILSNAGNAVSCLALDASGAIVVGGMFGLVDYQSRSNLVRLNRDGLVDDAFFPFASGGIGAVSCVGVQADGKYIVAGMFPSGPSEFLPQLVRLSKDGNIDSSFVSPAYVTIRSLNCLAIQSNGDILVAGDFTITNKTTGLIRLTQEGNLDPSFSTDVQQVRSIVIQVDGKVVIGGWFSTVNGAPSTNIARLLPNGASDTGFSLGAFGTLPGPTLNPSVAALTLKLDSSLLIGGNFTQVGNSFRTNFCKVLNPDATVDQLTFDGSLITWKRSGGGPEVSRVMFDVSTNGNTWSLTGAGQRTTEGWQLGVAALPSSSTVRARGFVQTGTHNGASWSLQTAVGAPFVDSRPLQQTNVAGSAVSLRVDSIGSQPLGYSWWKDGAILSQTMKISGASNELLMISNCAFSDSGQYVAIITNAFGAVTTLVASVSILDPWIDVPPTDKTANRGENVTFNVGVRGTPPFSFQWLRDGTNLIGETLQNIAVTNVQVGNAGAYSVIVSNFNGSITSSVAHLTVNAALPDAFDVVADSTVASVAIQNDGKILIGGYFSSVGENPRARIARLYSDGLLDTTFDPGANLTGRAVHCLAVQVDDKTVVGGDFSTLDGHAGLVRINPDGTVDTSFVASVGGQIPTVNLILQSQGGMIVCGSFSSINDIPITNIARLDAFGTVDQSFQVDVSGVVTAAASQPDGRVLIAGFPGLSRGQPICRLNSNGSLDEGFAPSVDNTITSLGILSDNRILITGFFTQVNGAQVERIACFKPDGSLDDTFSASCNGTVSQIIPLVDGGAIIAGQFSMVDGQNRSCIARISGSGTLDLTFAPIVAGAPTPHVDALALDDTGALIMGGWFQNVAAQPRTNMCRLTTDGHNTSSLRTAGSEIIWNGSGFAPEPVWVTVEASTNGIDWSMIGNATKSGGEWRAKSNNLSISTAVRVSALIESCPNSEYWFQQQTLTDSNAPVVLDIASTTNGYYQIQIEGLIGQVIALEESLDLTFWQPVMTNTLSSGKISILKAFAEARCFFRAHAL